MKKIYSEKHGWGEIIANNGKQILVRWDSSPWYPEEIDLPEAEKTKEEK